MKKARVILSAVAILAVCGGIFAFKANRTPHLLFSIDTQTTDPALKLCTFPVNTSFTTIEADKAPGAVTVFQNTYYSAPVNSTVCPSISIWRAL